MPWYLFAVVTPTLYSFTNFIDKYLLEKKIKDSISIAVLSGLVSGVLGVILGLITKFKYIGLGQTAILLFAGILLVLYLIPYYEAMKIEDASRIVPLFQFIPVLTLILSALILKETLTLKQIFGLTLVVSAGFFISVEKIEGRLFKPRKALWFMLLTCLMYGSVAILFRLVVKTADFWVTLSYEYIGTGIGAVILLFFHKIRHNFKQQIKEIRSIAGLIATNRSLEIIGQMSESYAVSLAAVPLVNLIGSIQPLIVLVEGLALSVWFPHVIKEDIKKTTITHKLISIIVIFIGLYLVYF